VFVASLTSAEIIRQASFDLLGACTTDQHVAVVKLKKPSKTQCALAGVREPRYREFTYDDSTEDCKFYKHKTLFSEVRPGCSGYTARYIPLLLFPRPSYRRGHYKMKRGVCPSVRSSVAFLDLTRERKGQEAQNWHDGTREPI